MKRKCVFLIYIGLLFNLVGCKKEEVKPKNLMENLQNKINNMKKLQTPLIWIKINIINVLLKS